MGGASELLGHVLVGDRAGREWTVTEAIKLQPSVTPGAFSTSYKVRASDGTEAFLKASDVGMAFSAANPAQSLMRAAASHEFERTILEHCRGSRLDRIVTPLDSGSTQVDVGGIRDFVFYIVFELADGDLRRFVDRNQGLDLAWAIGAVHNYCVAFSQIHGIDIFHNDFKPANALVFKDIEKVADLGRATSPKQQAIHENYLCAGDLRFAPPEQLYPGLLDGGPSDKFIRAKAGDLYNLGSVIHYLITKRMLTPEILRRLEIQFKPPSQVGGWGDGLEGVLPYWRKAFDIVMTEFYDELPRIWLDKFQFALDDIRNIILHLCDPDPRLRGDLTSSPVMGSKYSLDKIISKMDNLKKRVQVVARAE